MLLGVVSDTHGQTDYTLDAVRMLESLEVDAVLHCGDVGSAEVVRLFKPWPTHFVLGNVDDAATIRRMLADFERLLPIARAAPALARRIGWLQQGRIATYLLYSFLTLLTLLIFAL